MAVTGSIWKSLSIIKLLTSIPWANRNAEDALEDVMAAGRESFNEQLVKLSNLQSQLDTFVATLNSASAQLTSLHNEINNFIGNAQETGVYFHLLGVDGRLNSNSAFVGRINQHLLTDTDDPNRPKFTGTAGRVGGALILVAAPNVTEMHSILMKLGTLFPIILSALGSAIPIIAPIGQEILDLVNVTLGAWDDVKALANNAVNAGKDFSTAPDLASLFDGESIIQNEDPRKWYASRLTDIIPLLDPNKDGTIGSSLVSLTDTLNSALLGTANNTNNLASAVRTLQGQIEQARLVLASAQAQIGNFLHDAIQTGVYLHWLGADMSLHNNEEFVRAVEQCFNDTIDKETPKFHGGKAVLGGVLLYLGAPSSAGLKSKFDKLRAVLTM